ncbi:chaplin [Streptomyces cylindrosporus]|uniref:Chaplin n=1 Tax=Streptomyces cylindrosporus TaxID=2927583 RepID=A0ABS9YGN7_9ACTN|nr:chaplin [Streptomyces cylindrosporus]MCI3275710.1 chaplin [Streptomyces cylindrosporus]
MRQVTRKSLMTVAAATGVIAAAGGYAHADSGASGSASDSPGVLSGNTVQAPVHVPVNACGNTVNVVGVLNPAVGNSCANHGGSSSGGYGDSGGQGHSGSGGAQAGGHSGHSPGVGSGNHVEAPIDVPVNVCGNTVDVVGVGNSATGNDCGNGGGAGGGHGTPPGGGHGTPPGGGHETPPGNPGTPGQPGTPGNPGTPGTPGTPGNPTTPGQPGTPGTPSSPGGSSHANQPGAQSVTQPLGSAQLAHTGSDVPLGLAIPVGAGALLAGAVLYRKARASA